MRDKLTDLVRGRRAHKTRAEQEERADPSERDGLHREGGEPRERAHPARDPRAGGRGRRVNPASTRLTIAAGRWHNAPCRRDYSARTRPRKVSRWRPKTSESSESASETARRLCAALSAPVIASRTRVEAETMWSVREAASCACVAIWEVAPLRTRDGPGDARHLVDGLGHRADALDRAAHRVLHGGDLAGDVLGRLTGLDGERLDLGGDDGKAAPGFARPRRLDR